MAVIVQLAKYREQSALRNGYHLLRCRFNQAFDAGTCLSDLAPGVLYQLSLPDDTSTQMLHAMILGFRGFRATATFDTVNFGIQIEVVDMHLFICDQIRFEMMYRLGWLEHIPVRHVPIFTLIKDWAYAQRLSRQHPPQLSRDHPDFHVYGKLIERDRQVYIRRQMPAALEAYKQSCGR
jgi:hypothetical protein